MIIVLGHLTISPDDQGRYLELCAEVVRQARETDGCLDFAIGADADQPGRINVAERWRDRSTLDAFRGAGTEGTELGAMIQGADVGEYDVAEPSAG